MKHMEESSTSTNLQTQVRRVFLQPSNQSATVLEQLKPIHQQTVQTADDQTLTGLTEMTPAQKSLFAALQLTPPSPEDLTKPVL